MYGHDPTLEPGDIVTIAGIYKDESIIEKIIRIIYRKPRELKIMRVEEWAHSRDV